LKGQEVNQMRKMAESVDGHPVIATVQHKIILASLIKERIVMEGTAAYVLPCRLENNVSWGFVKLMYIKYDFNNLNLV
jgi:hypothetical protein